MKLKEIYEELSVLAKQQGITIRKDSGSFKSGYALVKEKQVVILNKTASMEAMSKVIAKSLYPEINNLYLKPVIREFIEGELNPKEEQEQYILEL
jgi:uncharacterized protein YqfB (UPF0267 family)